MQEYTVSQISSIFRRWWPRFQKWDIFNEIAHVALEFQFTSV